MEQSGTSALLQGAVQDLASGVVSALRGGGHPRVVLPADTGGAAGELALAAVRVLGADAMLPSVLLRTPPDPAEAAVFRKAVEAHPPRADAAPSVRWSHWGIASNLRRIDPFFSRRDAGRSPGNGSARRGRTGSPSPVKLRGTCPRSPCPARTAR
ncbi:conserved hypothetical protein [Streptomyces griseoflavus Tu4000]|uniref:Uncharacterized protein n=1 Tax=Streptomyces griseoflavus Tu4000 TaxID=467200 RepID=D9XSE1_9ACTN|nr:conserved hypothetical protein [Streptomyces griseoflavus Tu4000]